MTAILLGFVCLVLAASVPMIGRSMGTTASSIAGLFLGAWFLLLSANLIAAQWIIDSIDARDRGKNEVIEDRPARSGEITAGK